jgi:hypothetical protein
VSDDFVALLAGDQSGVVEFLNIAIFHIVLRVVSSL